MRYVIDCEFDGFGGPLMTMALIREDRECLYLIFPHKAKNKWVKENVVPHIWDIPSPMPGGLPVEVKDPIEGAYQIAHFLSRDDGVPHIIADWPDDIAYFCKALMVGPGQMVGVRHFTTEVIRGLIVTDKQFENHRATRHNSWWDATMFLLALQGKLK